jgi:hypothetical protein
MLIPHKFDTNASNLVLMSKKTGGGGHYNFFFFLNHVLYKTRRTLEEPMGRTPSIRDIYISALWYVRHIMTLILATYQLNKIIEAEFIFNLFYQLEERYL